MSELDLMNRVSKLPPNLKEEVSDFVDFLISKHITASSPKQPLKFGMMKGNFIMSEDFDEALDLIDARLIEERRSKDSIPFDNFLHQLKDEGKLDS